MSGASAEAVRGRATGSLIFTGFGALWCVGGLSALHRMSLVPMLLLAAVTAILIAGDTMLMRRSRELPPAGFSKQAEERMRRLFVAVNIIQWVSVATAIVVLNLLEKPEYIVPAIAVIVGLHLFPLAGAFRYPMHYVTGGAVIAWSLWCIARLDGAELTGIGAVGTGIILLLSAVTGTLLALESVRTSPFRSAARAS